MSSEIFKWMPHSLSDNKRDISFNTVKTEYENGMIQRRNRFGRETGLWSFTYIMGLYAPHEGRKLRDEILSFFRARKGSYDNFYLPSWELETEVVDVSSGKIIWVKENPANLGFSATSGDYGNFIYICDHYYRGNEGKANTNEVGKIKSMVAGSGKFKITLVSSLINSYSVGAKVMKAAKVFFNNDSLERAFMNPHAYTVTIEFMEDIADLY